MEKSSLLIYIEHLQFIFQYGEFLVIFRFMREHIYVFPTLHIYMLKDSSLKVTVLGKDYNGLLATIMVFVAGKASKCVLGPKLKPPSLNVHYHVNSNRQFNRPAPVP
jgi:hypothetical protein